MNPAPPLASDLRPERFGPVWFDCRWPGRLHAQYRPLTMRPNPTTPRAIHHAEFDTNEIARIVAASPARAMRMPRTKRLAEKPGPVAAAWRSEEHTSELQSRGHLVCRLLLEKKKRV